jgi:hypothetical protein
MAVNIGCSHIPVAKSSDVNAFQETAGEIGRWERTDKVADNNQ